MAFRPPSYNLWCRVLGMTNAPGDPDVYGIRGWSLCQVRGPANNQQTYPWLPGVLTYWPSVWEILFPKWSDVRCKLTSGTFTDTIEFETDAIRKYEVHWVDDKACGFSNEYRLTLCTLQAVTYGGPGSPRPLPAFNPAVVPPVGYTPLPTVPPAPAPW